MRIVLLGAPGAGKGTHCKRIVDKYGLVHLSSGDILRQERANGSELGKKAQEYMDSGALVPDDLIVAMMAGAVDAVKDKGFVLDGFPRTVNQAKSLDESLKNLGLQIDVVLDLEVNDSVVVDRITGRRSCPGCGAVYHVKNIKPKVEGVCDSCGGALVQRPDDVEDVVKNRLTNYHTQTAPVVDYYKGNNDVFEVDGNKSIDELASVIFGKLDSVNS